MLTESLHVETAFRADTVAHEFLRMQGEDGGGSFPYPVDGPDSFTPCTRRDYSVHTVLLHEASDTTGK